MKLDFKKILKLLSVIIFILVLNLNVFADTGSKSEIGNGYNLKFNCPSSWGNTPSEYLSYFFCNVKSVVTNKNLMDGIGIIALFLGTFALMYFLLNKRIIKDVKVAKVLAVMISFFTVTAAVMLIKEKNIGLVLFFGGWMLLAMDLLLSIGLFVGVYRWLNEKYPNEEHSKIRITGYIISILLILSLFMDSIKYIDKQSGINSTMIALIYGIINNIFIIVFFIGIIYFIISLGSLSSDETKSGISRIVNEDVKNIKTYKKALDGFLKQLGEADKLHKEETQNIQSLLQMLLKFLKDTSSINTETKVGGGKN